MWCEKPVSAGSGKDWVVEMEKMLDGADRAAETARWSKPSIYRVPEWLKDMATDDGAYRPRLVSLGPFHHDDELLRPMEEHKRRAVLHIVKRSRKRLGEFAAAIAGVADELLDAYDNLGGRWRREDEGGRRRFVEMMVLDGCFLLEMMKGLSDRRAPDDYAPNDPVFSVHGMLCLWVGIRGDMLVIENQIPLLALYRLEQVWRGNTPLRDAQGRHHREQTVPPPIGHLSQELLWWESSMPCAVELTEAGIHLKKCRGTHVIDYRSRVLCLPTVSIHDGTEKIFLNLLAFERLHGDAGSEATDYMIFMDNIVNSERDVALLRSKGIIRNLLSSDTEAAQLFNNLSKGAVLSPFSRLHDVRRKVNAHCRRPWNRWRAILEHNYMSNPCVLISLIAAAILLVATLLQTVYSVLGVYKS
ncbi:UPF0481 protein At3g47200-like [Oryza brachyantha]|uniref:UPF0481 protein At3g47200-like n=1 Tax=Oryza brachyantha TaxID=4533 RepID=UPI0003EAC8BB|nr:UPF0481 protein At3g47200-like [Oryza brachyantha]